MATKLDTVTARNALPARNPTYWQKLDRGNFIGFRKLTPQSTGTWYARYRDGGPGRKRSLGKFIELSPNDRFSAAKKAAEAFFLHLSGGGSNEPMTVKDACAAYAKHVRDEKGDGPADDLVGRYRRQIDSAPIGEIELSKLTAKDVEKWRKSIAAKPALVSRRKTDEPATRPRGKGTLNRDMTPLRAALNYAKKKKHVISDTAWSEELKPAKNADGSRSLYLDRTERKVLLEAAAPDIRKFLHGMALLPLRPGALANLKVGFLDPRTSTLFVEKDKKGADRKIALPPHTVNFLADLAKGRQATEPLFTRADGAQWNKDNWYDPVKDAVKAAGLPRGASAYTLRHSVITDLVSESLVDLLTIAKLSGTSVIMIEKHYGHVRNKMATAALATLEL